VTIPRDPGLQAERTALAWRRTVISTAMCSALVALGAYRVGHARVLVLAALVGGLTGALASAVLALERRVPDRRSHPWPLLALTATTVAALAAIGAGGALVTALQH
jgi:hypothetical protein